MTSARILYLSVLSSESRINEEYRRTGRNPGFAVQKFSRLFVKGLRANGADVLALSNPPLSAKKGAFVSAAQESDGDVNYLYVPYFNFPLLKHLCILVYTFLYVLFWGFKDRKNKAIVCDVLSISVCLGALLASKINRVQSVAVVTDIYGLMVSESIGLRSRVAKRLNAVYVSHFSKYVLLTEQMNALVNPKGREYIVMEALCDNRISDEQIAQATKSVPRTMLYAGGLFEKYGLKMLVEAFLLADVPNTKLVLYGDGAYVEELKSVVAEHPQIEYRGVATNEEVVAAELEATLLVNPRFTSGKFTKYSFPSKNMEYMTSGTPLLTTNLPGMPQEYRPYVFLFEEETLEGYADAIRTAFANSQEQLNDFGLRAREFVLREKNNLAQGRRVLELIDKLNIR